MCVCEHAHAHVHSRRQELGKKGEFGRDIGPADGKDYICPLSMALHHSGPKGFSKLRGLMEVVFLSSPLPGALELSVVP